jgi:hypothetical protein
MPAEMQSDGEAFSAVMREWLGVADDDGVVQAAALHNMLAALAVGTGAAVPAATATPARGGSRAGRKSNVDRDLDKGVTRLQRDYFIETPQ